jgi:hypothetical protein
MLLISKSRALRWANALSKCPEVDRVYYGGRDLQAHVVLQECMIAVADRRM